MHSATAAPELSMTFSIVWVDVSVARSDPSLIVQFMGRVTSYLELYHLDEMMAPLAPTQNEKMVINVSFKDLSLFEGDQEPAVWIHTTARLGGGGSGQGCANAH